VSGKVTEQPHPRTRSLEPALSGVEGCDTLGVLSRATGRGLKGRCWICAVGIRFQFGNLWTKTGRNSDFGLDLP
jgi:hypothetical protein